jgi:hypothetical protein
MLYFFVDCEEPEALRDVLGHLARCQGFPTTSLVPIVGPIMDFIRRARATSEITPEGVLETMIDSVAHSRGVTWIVMDSAATVAAFVTARLVEPLPTLSPAVEVTLGYVRPGTPLWVLRRIQADLEAWAIKKQVRRLYFVTKRPSPAWERLGWRKSELAIYERRVGG